MDANNTHLQQLQCSVEVFSGGLRGGDKGPGSLVATPHNFHRPQQANAQVPSLLADGRKLESLARRYVRCRQQDYQHCPHGHRDSGRSPGTLAAGPTLQGGLLHLPLSSAASAAVGCGVSLAERELGKICNRRHKVCGCAMSHTLFFVPSLFAVRRLHTLSALEKFPGSLRGPVAPCYPHWWSGCCLVTSLTYTLWVLRRCHRQPRVEVIVF